MNSSVSETVHFDYSNAEALCSDAYLVPVMERFIRPLPRGSRVVDLGCGNGAMLRTVLRPDLVACGIDGSVSGIDMAVKSIPNGSFFVADVTAELPARLSPGSFDAVISTETIEHVVLPRALVRNAFDLLKPGGAFIVSTPYNGYLKNVVLSLTNSMDKHFTALWDGGHIKFWSRKTLSALLTEAGFEQLAFEGAGRIPFLWKSMVIVARKPV